MKNDRNPNPSAESRHERLGRILSSGLNNREILDCPNDESLAALVEGCVSPEERDRLMKHISACGSCFETFLLTSELQSDEQTSLSANVITAVEPDSGPNRSSSRFMFSAKTMALAASILVAAVSVYVFYTNNAVPKNADQLLNRGVEKAASRESAPAPVPAPVFEKRTEGSGQPLGKNKGERKMKVPADEFKQTPQQEMNRHIKASAAKKIGLKTKTSQMPRTQFALKDEPPVKLEEQRQAVQDMEKEQDFGSDTAGSSTMKSLAQMEQLKKSLDSYPSYIPGTDLRRLFREAIAISASVENLPAQTAGPGAVARNDREFIAIARSASPAFRANRNGDRISLGLNMEYFLSRSTPGSVDFKFFSLARAGWSGDGGSWSKGVKLSESADLAPAEQKSRRVRKNETGLSPGAKERQLKQWNVLLPQLPREYRNIAAATIKYLEKTGTR